jgi:hypothetical protein
MRPRDRLSPDPLSTQDLAWSHSDYGYDSGDLPEPADGVDAAPDDAEWVSDVLLQLLRSSRTRIPLAALSAVVVVSCGLSAIARKLAPWSGAVYAACISFAGTLLCLYALFGRPPQSGEIQPDLERVAPPVAPALDASALAGTEARPATKGTSP